MLLTKSEFLRHRTKLLIFFWSIKTRKRQRKDCANSSRAVSLYLQLDKPSISLAMSKAGGKESILDLASSIDKKVSVKFSGGRHAIGVLKGYDELVNLVLDDTEEFIMDADGNLTEETRELGLIVCRGTQVTLVSPEEGREEIENPFLEDDDADGEDA